MPQDFHDSRSDDTDVTLEHSEAATLRFLDDRDEPVENVRLLTVAVREAELDRRDLRPDDLPVRAVHDHVVTTLLPALTDEGLVEYDRASDTIGLAASSEELDSFLSSRLER